MSADKLSGPTAAPERSAACDSPCARAASQSATRASAPSRGGASASTRSSAGHSARHVCALRTWSPVEATSTRAPLSRTMNATCGAGRLG